MKNNLPFWKTKTLHEMSAQEWESLCDGCAKCCLLKLEDEETNEVLYTDIACTLLDCESCKCSDYTNRFEKVQTCNQITPDNIESLFWLPESCAYRLVFKGNDLPDWHPLICGNETDKHAGHSIKGRCISENVFSGDEEDRLVNWPLA